MLYYFALLANGIDKKRLPRAFECEIARLNHLNVLEKNATHIRLKAHFVIGIVRKTSKIFVKSFNPAHNEDFILEKGTFLLHNGDIILAKIPSVIKRRKGRNNRLDSKKTASKSQRLIFIAKLSRSRPHTLAILAMRNGAMKAIELGYGKERVLDIKASQKSLKVLPKGCVVKVELENGAISEVLGVIDDESIDEKIALTRYNRAESFSKEVDECLNAFSDVEPTLETYPKRENLTHLPFCVIDPENAKDHDDAIYFDSKARVLYVGIADVSEYVALHSPLDKEARIRGFSVYLPHKVINMLPSLLSSHLCSLKAHFPRLALVWKISLDKEANVINQTLSEAIINVVCLTTYQCVESAMFSKESSDVPKNVLSMLKAYLPYVKRLKARRLLKGYEFACNDMQLKLDENGAFLSLESVKSNLAHSIIEESMILANLASAKMLESHSGGLFRIHPPPKERHIQELIAQASYFGLQVRNRNNMHDFITSLQQEVRGTQIAEILDSSIIHSFARARYSADNKGHFGLGFSSYTHFTSPIRRYSDLVTHRILKAILHNDKSLRFMLDGLNAIAEEINIKERESSAIEQEFYDRKIMRHIARLLARDDEIRLQALVIDRISHCIALDTFPQLRITLEDSLDCYNVVWVRISGVNLIRQEVFGEVIDTQEYKLKTKVALYV